MVDRDEKIKELNHLFSYEDRKLLAEEIEKMIAEEKNMFEPTALADYYLAQFKDDDRLEFKRGTFSCDVMTTLLIPVEEMPLFIGDPHIIIRSIVQWRLKLGR